VGLAVSSLAEFCIAMSLAGTVAAAGSAGLSHVVLATTEVESRSAVQSSGAFAVQWLGEQVRQAGALTPPTTVDASHPVTPALPVPLSADSAGSAGDRLRLRHESQTDCLGNSKVSGVAYYDAARNPAALTQDNLIYVSLTATGGPSLMCDPDNSGPATAQPVATQVLGLWLRLRLDGDTRWLRPAAVTDWGRVRLVEVCLVLQGARNACPSDTSGSRSADPRLWVGVFRLRNAPS
jgi:hypothetical protein